MTLQTFTKTKNPSKISASMILIFLGLVLIIIGSFVAKYNYSISAWSILFGIIFIFILLGLNYLSYGIRDTKKAEKERKIVEIAYKFKEKGAWFLILKFVEKHQEFFDEISKRDANTLFVYRTIPLGMSREYMDFGIEKKAETISKEFEKLRDLLSVKYNIDIERERLLDVLCIAIDEFREQNIVKEFEQYKKIILSEHPTTLENFVDFHLKHYGEDSLKNPYINFLTRLLTIREFDFEQEKIVNMVASKKKMLSLEYFEKSLIREESKKKIDLNLMSGYDFEQFLGELYKKMCYKVIQTKLSGDQGADLIIEKFGEKTAVQAKCYYESVGNRAIQEVVTAKNHYNCDKALVVITSYFTRQAIILAKSNKVELWDRNKLDKMIEQYW